jgi:hypothetical protein
MKLGLIRIGWTLVAVGIAACHFPQAKDPDPDDALSQSNVTPTRTAGGGPSACDVAMGAEAVSALLSAVPSRHPQRVDPLPAVMAEDTCRRESEERLGALIAEGNEVEARRVRLDQEQRRDLQDQQLLDQLQALCKDGNARACDAFAFADGKRGCCTWHHGARMCSQGKVVCFDGEESARCSC